MQTKPSDVKYCGVNLRKMATANPELNSENVRHLLQFVKDRYAVHLKKDFLKLPPPWTDNPIIAKYKFTNVRREHDRQTRHLIRLISKNGQLSLEDQIVNTFMFRAWNNEATFTTFGFPHRAEEIYEPMLKEAYRKHFLKLEKAEPERKWWSSAYNQGGTKAAWKFPAGDGYQRAYAEADAMKHADWEKNIPLRPFHIGPWLKKQHIVKKILNPLSTQETVFETIKTVRGFSDFLAYQVFVDLTYIEEFPFSENHFTVAGPGCKKGLDYIFENYDGMTYSEAIFWLTKKYDKLIELEIEDPEFSEYSPKNLFTDLPQIDRCMNVMSMENCMCELSKYIRAATNTGGPRNKYKYKEV